MLNDLVARCSRAREKPTPTRSVSGQWRFRLEIIWVPICSLSRLPKDSLLRRRCLPRDKALGGERRGVNIADRVHRKARWERFRSCCFYRTEKTQLLGIFEGVIP
jgi:hypothetical protein